MPRVRLIKRFIESLPFVVEDGDTKNASQIVYTDTELQGFGLVVGTHSKTYFAQRYVNGKTIRVTIGKHGVFTPEQARNEAMELLVRMARGENPNETKRAKALTAMTLQQAIKAYKDSKKNLSQAILNQLKYAETTWFADWISLPLNEIKKDMIFKRHVKLGKDHGEATSNQAMRTLRAVYNFTLLTNESLPANPVLALSQNKSWFTEKRRDSVITPSQLRPWFNAVMLLENTAARDFLRLLLFTGMRKGEGLPIAWKFLPTP